MKKVLKLSRILFFFSLLLISEFIFGQDKHAVKVLGKYKKNSVTLRWAPSDPYVWQLGLKYGYTIERFTLSVNGKWNDQAASRPKPLSSTPVKPYSKEAFEELSKTEERAGIVQEMIYGEEFGATELKDSPASVLKKSKELENRFGLALFTCDMSQKVAIAAGLLWFDKSPSKGARYAYRIQVAQIPEGIEIEPGVIVLDIDKEIPLPPVEKVNMEFADLKTTLSWPVFLYQGIYTAYYIERSTDGKNFKPLNEVPYVQATEKKDPENAYYSDSIPDNQKTYYYRIKGVTPFAETGPPSKLISGKGKKALEGVVFIDSTLVIDNKRVFISWDFPEDHKDFIKGFYVSRAKQAGGVYTDLNSVMLPVTQKTFVDEKPNTYNYYKVKYIPKEGNDIFYTFPHLAQLIDSIPPAIPTGLKGTVDSLGIARVSWSNNNDEDLQGYRVFRANSLDEEFIEATRVILTGPEFIDTVNINTLTKDVYYQVISVDNHFNPSEYSAPLKLKRPDKIPPVPPVFTKTEREGVGIKLEWIKSSSEDVSKYILFRRDLGKDSLTKVSEWGIKNARESFKDSTATLGKSYQYVLQVLDSAGNLDKVVSKEIFFETGVRKPISNIRSTVDRAGKKVVLEWDYGSENVSKCIIYRALEGEPVRIYRTLGGGEKRFEDKNLSVNNNYIYKIKLTLKGGAQTELSEAVKVKY